MGVVNLQQRDHVLVVAEIGNNHEGSVELATRLVELAAAAGVDAVKFQTCRPEYFVAPSNTARLAQMRRFALPREALRDLSALARSLGLLFISTPLDLPSVDLLEPLVDAFKIASGDNTFYPLLERVASSDKPLILSTGLLDLAGVRTSMEYVRDRRPAAYRNEIAVLHCVCAYPAPIEQANLRAIATMAAQLDCAVGYSDHTVGADAAPLAVALGATIIEKHFTADKHYSEFRDHALSADPEEMREVVRRVRAATRMSGTGDKVPQPCEAEIAAQVRRSIVAAADLPEGHVLSWSDLLWVRPAGGLPPGGESQLVGAALARPMRLGDQLGPADVVRQLK